MTIFVFQLCNEDGMNRLVDRIVVDFNDGVEWIKKVYSWCTNWKFAQNPDGSNDITNVENPEEFGFFYMLGTSEGRLDVHILVERRTLH